MLVIEITLAVNCYIRLVERSVYYVNYHDDNIKQGRPACEYVRDKTCRGGGGTNNDNFRDEWQLGD